VITLSEDEEFVEWFRTTHTRMYNEIYNAFKKQKVEYK
tara:strand:- start:1007 stop:1120 length:114 start_codon:yes stop_codon:yes gene_type:complete